MGLTLFVVSVVFLMIDVAKKPYEKNGVVDEQKTAKQDSKSLQDKLNELQALKNNGTITEEEYKSLRDKIISSY